MAEIKQDNKNSITKKQKITLIVCLSMLVVLIVGVVVVDAVLPNKVSTPSTSDSTNIIEVSR